MWVCALGPPSQGLRRPKVFFLVAVCAFQCATRCWKVESARRATFWMRWMPPVDITSIMETPGIQVPPWSCLAMAIASAKSIVGNVWREKRQTAQLLMGSLRDPMLAHAWVSVITGFPPPAPPGPPPHTLYVCAATKQRVTASHGRLMCTRAVGLLLFLLSFTSANRLHELISADSIAELKSAPMDGINEKSPQGGQTPLMMAVLMGKDEAVRILLRAGADTSVGEKDGYTPCHGAGFQGRSAIMKILLEHGLPCTTDKHADGFTPLHRACWGREARHTETVRALLKAGAPPDQEGPDGRSPLEMASNNIGTQKLLRHRLSKQGKFATDETKAEL